MEGGRRGIEAHVHAGLRIDVLRLRGRVRWLWCVQPDDDREFSVMVAIFSVSAGMVGVCLTGIGLLQVLTSLKKAGTLADEFLSVNAVIFLGCCLLTFLSFRLRHSGTKEKIQRIADVLFFVGLLMMAVICVLISRAFV